MPSTQRPRAPRHNPRTADADWERLGAQVRDILARRTVGLELEAVWGDRTRCARTLREHGGGRVDAGLCSYGTGRRNGYATSRFESDASLPRGGAELVSRTYGAGTTPAGALPSADAFLGLLRGAEECWVRGFARATRSCGLHIHISHSIQSTGRSALGAGSWETMGGANVPDCGWRDRWMAAGTGLIDAHRCGGTSYSGWGRALRRLGDRGAASIKSWARPGRPGRIEVRLLHGTLSAGDIMSWLVHVDRVLAVAELEAARATAAARLERRTAGPAGNPLEAIELFPSGNRGAVTTQFREPPRAACGGAAVDCGGGVTAREYVAGDAYRASTGRWTRRTVIPWEAAGSRAVRAQYAPGYDDALTHETEAGRRALWGARADFGSAGAANAVGTQMERALAALWGGAQHYGGNPVWFTLADVAAALSRAADEAVDWRSAEARLQTYLRRYRHPALDVARAVDGMTNWCVGLMRRRSPNDASMLLNCRADNIRTQPNWIFSGLGRGALGRLIADWRERRTLAETLASARSAPDAAAADAARERHAARERRHAAEFAAARAAVEASRAQRLEWSHRQHGRPAAPNAWQSNQERVRAAWLRYQGRLSEWELARRPGARVGPAAAE